jgi:DNA-binding NarL/FixJ family response regulator
LGLQYSSNDLSGRSDYETLYFSYPQKKAVKDSIISFYTTAWKARFSAYAGFAFLACCYIAVNALVFHRPERNVSYEVTLLLASMVAVAPVVYHFVRQMQDATPNSDILYNPFQTHQTIQPLRLLLAEDHGTATLVRTLLQQQSVEVEARADAIDIVEKLRSLKTDLIVMDVELAGVNGLEVAREITKLSATKVVIFQMYSISEPDFHIKMIRNVEASIPGSSTVPPIIAKTHFTPRQLRIIHLIAQHRSIEDIARLLRLDEDTVQDERTKIMQELNLSSVGNVVVYAEARYKFFLP